jgi:hypothetical protein
LSVRIRPKDSRNVDPKSARDWHSAAELKQLSSKTLWEHDQALSDSGPINPPAGFYRDEINRRTQERATMWLIWLTVAIVGVQPR